MCTHHSLLLTPPGRILVAHVSRTNQANGPAGYVLWRVGERLEKVLDDQAYQGVFAEELARWSIEFE